MSTRVASVQTAERVVAPQDRLHLNILLVEIVVVFLHHDDVRSLQLVSA